MGIISYIKTSWDSLPSAEFRAREEAMRQLKDYPYLQFEPQNAWSLISGLSTSPVWTGGRYADKANALLCNSVAKTCINYRAIGVGDIKINVESSSTTVKGLLESPNSQDGTFGIFVRNLETVLSIGGGFYWFWDLTLPANPKLYNFRPDFVQTKAEGTNRVYYYNPSGKFGTGTEPEMIFTNDITGKTISAQRRTGPKQYQSMKAAIQPVFYYDPTTDAGGMAPGDSALRAVDIINAIDGMINRKVTAGGNKAGFFQLTGQPSAAEVQAIKVQMQALNSDGHVNVLPPGMSFTAAQLTFQDMSLLEIRNQMARDICTALCVPAELIDEGQSTYATGRAKDKMFYRNFIDPEATWLLGKLQSGIRMYVDPKATISVDETSIAHLESDQLDTIKTLAPTGAFTINEIRAIRGLPPHADGDTLLAAGAVPQGQPENKPKGPVGFNADAGGRGDNNA